MIRVRELAKEVNEITEDDFILISNPHWDAKMKASNLVNPNAQYLDSEGKVEPEGLSYQLKNLNTLDDDPDYIGQSGKFNEDFYIAVQSSGTKWQKLNNIAIDITDIAALSAVPLDGAEIPVIGEFAGTTAIYISSTQIGGGSYLKALFDISGKGLNGKKIQIGGIIHSGYAINEQDYTSESDYQLSVSCNLISGEDIEYNAQSSSVIEFKSYHKRIRFYAEVTPAVGVDTIELLFTIHNTTGNNANARLFQLARVFYSLAEEPVSYERDLDTLKELVKYKADTTHTHTDKLDTCGGTITGNLTLTGNLTVQGTQFIADVETVEIEDNLLLINKNEPGAGVTAGTAGIEIERGSETNYQFLFDETTDTFRVGLSGSLQPVATREDLPITGGFAKWDNINYRFITEDLDVPNIVRKNQANTFGSYLQTFQGVIVVEGGNGISATQGSENFATGRTWISGGNSQEPSVTRGAYAILCGNEYPTDGAGAAGALWLASGNVTGSYIDFRAKGSTTNLVRIIENGYVGFGKTDPAERVDINGNLKASGSVNAVTALQLNGTSINTTGTLSNVAYKGQDNNFTTSQTVTGDVRLANGSADRGFTGNDNAGRIIIGGGSGGGGTNGASIYLTGNTYASNPGRLTLLAGQQSETGKGDIIFRTGSSSQNYMVINHLGNVRIGATTDATEKLEVVGNIKASGNINAVTDIQLNGTSINTTGTLSNVAYYNKVNPFTQPISISPPNSTANPLTLNRGDMTNFDIVIQKGGSDRWRIRMDNATETGSNTGSNFAIVRRNDDGTIISPFPLFIYRSNGFVGINNNTPTEALDVTGNIKASGNINAVTALQVNGTDIFSRTNTWSNIQTFSNNIIMNTAGGVRTIFGNTTDASTHTGELRLTSADGVMVSKGGYIMVCGNAHATYPGYVRLVCGTGGLIQASGNTEIAGTLSLNSTARIFRMGPDSDGSWQFAISGVNLVIQKKESGAWVTKSTIT